MNTLSRNTPVAFVVGAAGFLGSHLVDKLLEKGIQVVGVDDLSSGRMENLEEAIKDKKFHLFNQSAVQPIPSDFPRLDYAFYLINPEVTSAVYSKSLEIFLKICQKYDSKIVLASSVELYDSQHGVDVLFEGEKKLASFTAENKTNARIVRLATIYGPRMHFRVDDPIIRLIKSAALEQLQKEAPPIDFTTRSLFVDDAVKLLIKAVMHGATAQKIYDGALSMPLKVAEVRQVLLDPLWHESRKFTPTELPPWPTPNLLKTENELSWQASTSLVISLKQTLSYFRQHPQLLSQPEETPKRRRWEEMENEQKEAESQQLQESEKNTTEKKLRPVKNYDHIKQRTKKISFGVGGILLIIFALLLPLISLGWNIVNIKSNVYNSTQNAALGNYDLAKTEIKSAKEGVGDIEKTLGSLSLLREAGVLQPQLQAIDQLLQLLDKTVDSLDRSISGMQNLSQSLKIISGEQNGEIGQLIQQAQIDLALADQGLGYVNSRLSDASFMEIIPSQLQGRVEDLKSKASLYQKVVGYGRSVTIILPQLIALNDKKSYLILLQDNTMLRPTGGKIISYGKISFDHGKLVNINVDNIENLDNSFKERVMPPTEVKNDLGKNSWFLADSNFDLDFPTSARTSAWFYQKEGLERVSGVIALDLTAVAKLIELTGPISLPADEETIDSSNLQDKILASTSSQNLLTPVLKELINRTFFLTNQNWPQVTQQLNQAFIEKHILVYMADPELFAYMTSKNWSGAVVRQTKEIKGERNEFLALSEANIGSSRANYFLQRSIELKSTIDASLNVSHQLVISYTNQSPSEVFPAGSYKNRLKVYLSGGSQLKKAVWGNEDITSKVVSFSDYGRAGFSFLLELNPKEQKNLVLEYKDFKPFELDNNEVNYKLVVAKQPGTDKDQFSFKLAYPPTLKAVSTNDPNGDSHELSFSSDLSQDRNFTINLQKSK